MSGNDVRERPAQPLRAAGPAFDLLVSKLRRPPVRPGTVSRSWLLERLAGPDAAPIVSVVAPAGYGKTTLLSQWAEHNGQAFAWVSLDERDNDPKVLLAYVAAALDGVEPVGGRVFEALASPASSVAGSVVPRLGSALASMTTPVVLVLDDVHLVENREGRAALSVLAEHLPAGSRLALAGREDPPLRTARLRAQGRLLEIGAGDLALTCAEAASLLAAAEVVLAEADLAALYERTEGWATGLYLAALAIKEGGGSPGGAGGWVGGGDRFVSEYVESELLGRISGRRREFLTRTAVLERLSGPLCNAVLDQPGSAATLAELARSNLLLMPLDRHGQWYRYHHLFRDMLLAELERREPDLLPMLRHRAAAWCQHNGLAQEAVEYAIAAGDVEAVARQVTPLWLPIARQGRHATLWRWIGWLEDQDGIQGHPLLMAQAALTATTGRPVEAERWADMVDHWQSRDAVRPKDPAAEAWAAVLRAILCRQGVEQMRADADEAAQRMAEANIVTPAAALLQGMARVISGDLDDGDAYLQQVSIGGVAAPEVLAVALGERSLLAMARGDWSQAEQLAGQARTTLGGAGINDSEAMPLVSAVLARLALHRGDPPAARQELLTAQRLRPLLTYATPHLAVQVRIELARVHLALADLAGARTLLREVDDLLRRRPALGTLVGQAEALRAQLASQRGSSVPAASALTGAELRLLPLLATHLSLPEIGDEMFLSRHTIKSQAISIYHKLGTSTRTQAVTRARELGLLEG